MRVLVVDDSPEILLTLSRLIASRGAKTTCAPDGKDALQILRKSEFDILVTDWEMPNVNGLELLKAITPLGLKMIVFSSSEIPESEKQLNVLYLKKPDDLKKLLSQF
jgi:CheY-like chemotaxis protein